VAPGLVAIVRAVAPDLAVPDEFEPVLAACVAQASAAWPDIALPGARFLGAVAERLARDLPVARALEVLHRDDLYLACGCAEGDAAALDGFERHCGGAISQALVATGATLAERADLGQVIRQRLLVEPADGGPPRIATYSARGALRAWVRVVATRETARMLPLARREVTSGDDELARLIAPDDDPEIGYLKRLYRDEFKLAFQAAVADLDDRARLMLRQHTLDGLGIDRLAALHGVHRATAARWIEAARDAILAGTQRQLIRRLHLSRTELDSVIRLIRSQLNVSLPRILT